MQYTLTRKKSGRETRRKSYKLYKYLSQFDRSAIQQAREEMTFWGWPSLFGKPPDGYDGLPDYKKPWMPDGIKTKASYLDAYRDILYIFI